jgi:hypothetical protein
LFINEGLIISIYEAGFNAATVGNITAREALVALQRLEPSTHV